uniref:Large ribosomal subunit protein mL53 n=1 Tax=Eptatretus burgeri TaxID=7764 RepID=A0A8C4QHF8_EPTBU
MAAPKALINLKAVKEISVQFCPFFSNVRATREFLARVNVERVRKTNYACVLRTEVRHDGSTPCVTVLFSESCLAIICDVPFCPNVHAFFFISPCSNLSLFIPLDDDEKLVMKSERLLCEEMISALQKLCQQKEPPSDLKK